MNCDRCGAELDPETVATAAALEAFDQRVRRRIHDLADAMLTHAIGWPKGAPKAQREAVQCARVLGTLEFPTRLVLELLNRACGPVFAPAVLPAIETFSNAELAAEVARRARALRELAEEAGQRLLTPATVLAGERTRAHG